MSEPKLHFGDSNLDEGSRNLQEFVRELTACQGRLRAYIASLMPGSSDVADVLQETNLALWKNRENFQIGTNFIAWSFTIARYEVLHQRDRAKRLGRLVFTDQLTEMLAEEVPDHFTHETYLRALESCMTKLSPTQREIIEARYQPGNSLEIHSRVSGRKAGALRIALYRIRDSLRNCIETSMHHKPA